MFVTKVDFNFQPTLSGKLLFLRPLLEADFEPLFAVASDPLIWEQHPENLRYKREVFLSFFEAAIDSRVALVAIDLATNQIIGTSRFSGLNRETKCVAIGYTFIARRYWGVGYNAEMKQLMLAHAFCFVERVVFFIGENNLRSRRAIEKIGARFVSTAIRKPTEGSKYNSVIYEILKSDFS
jgi:RimJ/RimL family protein N-acetyltransferase